MIHCLPSTGGMGWVQIPVLHNVCKDEDMILLMIVSLFHSSTVHLLVPWTLDLLLLAVSDRKRVGFSLILLSENRFGFRSELAQKQKVYFTVNNNSIFI